jgi:hypothetical protein
MRSQRDFRFPLAVTEPAPAFYQEQFRLLREKRDVILDYQSLLSLTQAKMLGYLERIVGEIYVDFGFFEKVQAELFKTEHSILKEAWSYLRSSRVKFLYNDIELSGDLQKLQGTLDAWLLRSIKFAERRGMVFVCDDLLIYRLALTDGVDAVNTFGILLHLKSEKLIDKKAYSKKIGQKEQNNLGSRKMRIDLLRPFRTCADVAVMPSLNQTLPLQWPQVLLELFQMWLILVSITKKNFYSHE